VSFTKSYAFRHPLAGLLVNLGLLTALGLLALGVSTPVITVEKLYLFNNTVSLLSALQQLAGQEEWGLFLVIGVFSIMFPILKIITLLLLWNLERADGPGHRRHMKWLATYGKWSMLDVFVVALLVVTVKLGALAEARVEPGLYAFAGSVLLTMVLSHWISHHTVAPGPAQRRQARVGSRRSP
jgi:paraquat-inducible protein A